ncbi:MAG: hypothetical protein MJK18_06960, partial [Bdellovibrionales bacterium]|nr:hypothetical protein [Bdellovibrionales bacterium]
MRLVFLCLFLFSNFASAEVSLNQINQAYSCFKKNEDKVSSEKERAVLEAMRNFLEKGDWDYTQALINAYAALSAAAP